MMMKLFKFSKNQKLCSLISNSLTQGKSFSSQQAVKPKKSFLINKTSQQSRAEVKVPFANNERVEIKSPAGSNKKEEYMKLNMGQGISSLQGLKGTNYSSPAKEDKVQIKENYACVYYKLPIDQEFNLFQLRNLLYAYIFVRQRKGHIYLNFADTMFKVIN
jgi:hypothetical protein